MLRPLTILTVLTLVFMAACQPAPVTVEVTRLVEVTRPVEVTRAVPVTEIVTQIATQLIEQPVTREIEITRVVEVEVTRIVERAAPTTAPAPRPTQPPASSLRPEAVIAAIQAAGLEADNVHPLTREEYKLAPYVGSGLRFLLPSRGENYGGRIFLVPDPAQRQALRSFYEEMGQASAILSSYLFEREHILLQLPGDIPEEIAQQYGAALQAAR